MQKFSVRLSRTKTNFSVSTDRRNDTELIVSCGLCSESWVEIIIQNSVTETFSLICPVGEALT